MGAIVIRTKFDEGTESAEVATSGYTVTIKGCHKDVICIHQGRIHDLTPKKIMG
jgi:hypothetical protein